MLYPGVHILANIQKKPCLRVCMDDLVSKLPILLLHYATYVLSPVTLFASERFAESEERNSIVESLKVKNPVIVLS